MNGYVRVLEDVGEKRVYAVAPPAGRLIAMDDQVHRVTEVTTVPTDQWTEEDEARYQASGEDAPRENWRGRPRRFILQPANDAESEGEHFQSDGFRDWRVLPEHYAVCVRCGKPMPCKHLRDQSRAAADLRRANRLMSIPEGACWSCEKPITGRQKSYTFPGENLDYPGGPAATFHISITECRISAMHYQERWAQAEPGREPVLNWYDPYSGRPNSTQRRLLAMAARGELGCHLTHIRVAKPGEDIIDMITNPERHDPGDYQWYPDNLPRRAERHVRPLVDAGLLAEPIPQALGFQESHYILTDDGWATHRRYPEGESA